MTKVQCMCVQSTITERCPAIISIQSFQVSNPQRKIKNTIFAKKSLFSKLMYHDMEWIGQAKLQVLWFYTESRQETGEDGDIVLILGNCTDKKSHLK